MRTVRRVCGSAAAAAEPPGGQQTARQARAPGFSRLGCPEAPLWSHPREMRALRRRVAFSDASSDVLPPGDAAYAPALLSATSTASASSAEAKACPAERAGGAAGAAALPATKPRHCTLAAAALPSPRAGSALGAPAASPRAMCRDGTRWEELKFGAADCVCLTSADEERALGEGDACQYNSDKVPHDSGAGAT